MITVDKVRTVRATGTEQWVLVSLVEASPYRTTGTPESVQVQVEPLLLPEVDGLMLLRGGDCVVVVVAVLFRLLARN
jgi:hypothetical protein